MSKVTWGYVGATFTENKQSSYAPVVRKYVVETFLFTEILNSCYTQGIIKSMIFKYWFLFYAIVEKSD